MRLISLAVLLMLPLPGVAQQSTQLIQTAVRQHILPRMNDLADSAITLADTAKNDCNANSAPLQTAYHSAFDAWISASHLRFGPTEQDNRAFALVFWPDPRGATPKSLSRLIASNDPVIYDKAAFTSESIAGRGYYALERLLFGDQMATQGSAQYRCDLIIAITGDLADTATAIRDEWIDSYGHTLETAGENDTYRSTGEGLQELFKAVTTGLQFTSGTRLGRPLGTFDKPRPRRAEAHRAGRSARHIQLSLAAEHDLAMLLAAPSPEVAANLDAAFTRARAHVERLNDPDFAGVATAQGRLHLVIVQQDVDHIHEVVVDKLGALLGVTLGFNALDGD